MSIRRFFTLLVAILVAHSAGIIGSLFTASSVSTWYVGVEKSALTPPSWLFGPVWLTLYTLMGVAAFMVWERGWSRRDVRMALGVFLLQLVLNALWSILFFGLNSPALALIDIALLWLAIAVTIALFARLSRTAAWLLVPYLLWVSFATYLNWAIWTLN